ncbi:MAG: cobyrinate a,c-diamide synthase [Thermotaleaceae bacterium]
MNYPRFVLAGTQSGVGKTTISIGIMAALKKRGLQIQPFKVGPDYIDPAFHTFVTGNHSRNLDGWMLESKVIRELFLKNSRKKDIAVIEGVMGLYDGFGIEKDQGSTAHISKILDAPVFLIVNGNGMSASAAAQIMGYRDFDKEVNLKGIILNNLSGQKHYDLLKGAIEKYTDIPCIGYMQSNSAIQLKSRHLGLIPSVEVEDLKKKIDRIAEMIEETIDIDQIITIAENTKPIDETALPKTNKIATQEVNIGIAYDKAFNFYYQDNLDLLEEMGARLIYFSPIEDKKLPKDIHGLYFGGGFPEMFSKELEENWEMRSAIRNAINKGIPTYAECGGLMYLTEAITNLDGNRHQMVGVFPTESKMTNRLQRFGYVHVNIEKPCVLTEQPISIRAHEFHRSITEETENCSYGYRVEKWSDGECINTWFCGFLKQNVLAGYAHIHFYNNKDLALNFIDNCAAFRNRRCEDHEK